MQSPFFVSLIQAEAKKKGVGEKRIRWILRDGNHENYLCFCFWSGVCYSSAKFFYQKVLTNCFNCIYCTYTVGCKGEE